MHNAKRNGFFVNQGSFTSPVFLSFGPKKEISVFGGNAAIYITIA